MKIKNKEVNMCMFCKADEVISSTTTHVVDYKGCLIIVKNVPCEECVQCGEIFISDDVAIRLEKSWIPLKRQCKKYQCWIIIR